MKSTQHTTRLTALASAMAVVLYAGNAAAIQRQITAATGPSVADNFTMLTGFGYMVGGTNNVVTTWDGSVFTSSSDYTGPQTLSGSITRSNMTVASTTPFDSNIWTAHDIQVFAPGTYTFDATLGGGSTESGTLNVTVGPTQLGIHMLFDWNTTKNIDVFVVVAPNTAYGSGAISTTSTCSGNATTPVKNCLFGGATKVTGHVPTANQVWMLATVDGNGDGIMGIPMPTGGPFAGFNAGFNFNGASLVGHLAPVATDINNLAPINIHGTASNINILANDIDIDNGNSGAITTAQLQGGSAGITISNPTGGAAVVNADGSVNWTDSSGVAGTDSFQYTLTDTDGNTSSPATVTIDVNSGNPPVANPDTLSTAEDTQLTITEATDLLANDTDTNSPNTLTVYNYTQPLHGSLTATSPGVLTYKPNTNFSGADTFTYNAKDPQGNTSNSTTVTINVAYVNQIPVAHNDSATASFNTPVTINVLANDSDTDGDTLTVAHGSISVPQMGGTTTLNTDNTITYTPPAGYTGPDSFTYVVDDGHGGTATATVNITVLGSAVYIGKAVSNTPTSSAITGGSNFTMLDGNGADVGGTNDIAATWDGTLKTSAADTTANMTLKSALPTPFFGFTWVAHNVTVYGPGSYTFEACLPDGSTHCTAPDPLSMKVGPTQIGMHMLFDWGQPTAGSPCGLANCSIDVVEVVELNKAFAGATDGSSNFGEKGAVFTMTSVDGNGDGIPGIPMVDGAFVGFNANFNLNLTPQFALPVVTAVASQNGHPTTVIVPSAGPVTITATAPAGASFDWNSTLLNMNMATDGALIAVNTGGTTSSTFVFNPATLSNGPVTARVTIRDPNKGNLANYAVVPLVVNSAALLSLMEDTNNNGIPDSLDSGLPTTEIPTVAANGGSYLLQSSAGTLRLGETAAAVGASTGNYAAGITAASIGVTDTTVVTPCVGGCFDYQVTGLTTGASINVVLPLSAAIPANAVARKFANGEWRNFSLLGGDALASAPGSAGTCPAPGDTAYHTGLNAGDFCVQLTITDGGRNDSDGTANGTIQDPIGLGSTVAITSSGVSTVGTPPTGGGCTIASTTVDATQRLDLWLLLGSWLAWFGLRRKSK